MISLLEIPSVFNLWSRLTGDISVKQKIISEHIRPFDGAKILDIGCGTGGISNLIREVARVSYTGVDVNPKYIEFAKKQNYPGTFYSADITRGFQADTDFDIVMALDMMHHINDEQVRKAIALARRSLKQNGRFIFLDPVITKDRSFFEKQLMKLDRGRFIRTKDANNAFLKESFSEIESTFLTSYLIPWTECIFCCK